MCDMAAVNSRTPTNLGFTFATQSRGHAGVGNPHAWGLGLYPEDHGTDLYLRTATRPLAARIIKEPGEAAASPMHEFLVGYAQDENMASRNFILHFRITTGTKKVYRNCHPFERELWGRSFVLAHNGSILLPVLGEGFEAVGDTDSEKFFCGVLNHLRQSVGSKAAYEALTKPQRGAKLHEAIMAAAPSRQAQANIYLCDGEVMVAHARNSSNPMYYQERGPGFQIANAYTDATTSLTFGVTKGSQDSAVLVVTGDEGQTHPPGPRLQAIPHGGTLTLFDGQVVSRSWAAIASADVGPAVTSAPLPASIRGGRLSLGRPDLPRGRFTVLQAPRPVGEGPEMIVGEAMRALAGQTLELGKTRMLVRSISEFPANAYGRELLGRGDSVVLLNQAARDALGLPGDGPWFLQIE